MSCDQSLQHGFMGRCFLTNQLLVCSDQKLNRGNMHKSLRSRYNNKKILLQVDLEHKTSQIKLSEIIVKFMSCNLIGICKSYCHCFVFFFLLLCSVYVLVPPTLRNITVV